MSPVASMVKRVLLLTVLMGPALALIGGSKTPSSSSPLVIRDNEVGVGPALMLGNSIKCAPEQTLLSLVDFMGMLLGHTSGVETVFFLGRMLCTLSSPSMVVCFGLSPLSLWSLTCCRYDDCDFVSMRASLKVSQGCFQDGFAVTHAANVDVMVNFSFWVGSISVESLPSSYLPLVLEDVRGLCWEFETDLLLDMFSFGQKTSLKGMIKGKRFLAKLLWSISSDLFFHLPQVLPLECPAAASVAAFDGGYCVRPLAAAASVAAPVIPLYLGSVEMVPGSFAHVVLGIQEGCLSSVGSDVLPYLIALEGSFVLLLAALVGYFTVCGAFLHGSSGRAAAFERVTPNGHLYLVAGISWICERFPWSFLVNGLVLGLRVLFSCITSLVVHARVLGLQSFVYALDGFLALESDGMDRHVLAGRLFLGTGEQASGRVDVPGKDNQQHAAAASMGSGLCLEATRGVQICQPCQDSSAPPVIPVCSILVRTLSGRTRVCSLPTGFTVLDLENCVSDYTAVPCSSFYLTYQGKVLSADQVQNFDSGSLVPVVMHGRLRGGSAIPGAWVCNVCHASGCWPTKNRCFRCGHARNTLVAGAPAFSPPVGREAAHPGRAPRAKAAPVNPTFRPPRVIPPKKSSSPANASSPPASPPTQVSPELLVATLRALGIGEDLLKQIQSSIVPPAAPKVERKEQKLFQLRGLIETQKSQVSKLEKSENHHRSQLEVCVANKQRREEELAALQAEYRSVTDGKLSPNSTPAASVVSSREPAESCDPDLMEDDPPPPAEGHPLVHELPAPAPEDDEQRTKAKRLKTNDTHASAHGVGHDPALFGQHIALCSDSELDMYLKEIQKRREAIVDGAASGVLIGDFEEEPEV